MLRRPPSLLAHFVALTLSAVLLALSYPLPGWGFLAWIALAPAGWLAATSRKPWRLVWTSAVVFGLWWVWMLRWLWPVIVPGAVATALFQSLFWVLALWATNVCVRRKRIPVAVALPLCWVGLEYVRCVWPWGGFAWFTLAQTQGDGVRNLLSPGQYAAAQTAEIFGQHGLSVLIAALSSAIAWGWLQTGVKPRLIVLSFFVFVWLSVCGWTMRAHSTWDAMVLDQDETRHFILSVVQTNSPHDNKLMPTVATYESDFAALSRLHAEAVESEDLPALVVWPETTVPGVFNPEDAGVWERWAFSLPDADPDAALLRARYGMPGRARALIAEYGVPTVVGGKTVLNSLDEDAREEYNSAFLVDGSGAVAGRYDKMHRVPFGEYIPLPEGLKKWVLATVSPYDFDYSINAGKDVTVFEIHLAPGESPGAQGELRDTETVVSDDNGGGGRRGPGGIDPGLNRKTLRFATPICFEDTDAALCRAMVYDPETGEKRVDALINLTTNGWFGHLPSEDHPDGGLAWRSVRYQHLQLASLRAIENRVPVVRSVNTGVSAIIDSTGRIVAMGDPGSEGVVRGELVVDGRRTLYAVVGDWPIRALAAVTLLLVLWARLTPPRARVLRRRRAASTLKNPDA